ncbi:hypothetical protein QTN24_02245 [Cupriavidus sp. SZY C1]|uniref:hypothetical protein n=1 Tax=Cupriavidus sp. SZY C1 TaxID=3055037 RepID=UPI0028B53334|nr:hypothetical protein [Cupriavidus sp. SZY C1]MDT6960305.1 hypothetical protein [Cupriavidus sp. SZY C1]
MLVESLVCLALVGLGALPLAMLGSSWLRWSGDLERLNGTLRVVAEQAEAGPDRWTLIGGDAGGVALCGAPAAGDGCAPGERIAVARLPSARAGSTFDMAAPATHVALWVRP